MNNNYKYKINTWIMITPWIVVMFVFWLYPFLSALYISFNSYNSLTGVHQFIGMANYIKILNDTKFWQVLLNTVIFTIGTVPVTTALALFFAVLINSKLTKFQNFYRSVFFLPSVTSMVVIALIFSNIYSQDGYLNRLLSLLNLPFPKLGWLMEPSTSLLSIMAMDIWMATGYYMVLILAGLQTIPNDIYEAADLSGATAWQKFWKITIYMLKPTLLFVIIINTIKSFQVFLEIYVMTQGGPLGKTTTLVYMIFDNAFNKFDQMGYAAAIGFIVFGILMIFSLVQMKILKTDD